MSKPTPQELRIIANDNRRFNQIGGQVDGIDWEVGHELGFVTPDEAVHLDVTPLERAIHAEPAPVLYDTAAEREAQDIAEWVGRMAARDANAAPQNGKPLTSKDKNANELQHIKDSRLRLLGIESA